MLASDVEGDLVLSSEIEGELVLSPVSDGDGVGKGLVGIDVSVGASVDKTSVSIERAGVGTEDVSSNSDEGPNSSGSSDSTSTIDSDSVESVEFVGEHSAYCSQYGQCPSHKHSPNDSDIPEHPSKEEISNIPSIDAAWQYLLSRILIAFACHL
jgi:hypothetical protein